MTAVPAIIESSEESTQLLRRRCVNYGQLARWPAMVVPTYRGPLYVLRGIVEWEYQVAHWSRRQLLAVIAALKDTAQES